MTTDSPQAQQAPDLKPCWCRSETQWLRVKAHMDHGEFGCKQRGLYVYCPNCWACGPTYNTDTEAREGWNRMRADLPRAAADDEQFDAWWDEYQKPYLPNGCAGYEAAKAAWMATPRTQTGLTVEAALTELREMFPQRSLIVSAFARPDEYNIAVSGEDEYELFSYETLDQCLTEVRAWANSHVEKEKK